MQKEQGFMSFEQLADMILGDQDWYRLGVLDRGNWALFYEFAKNPKNENVALDVKATRENVQSMQAYTEQPDVRAKLDKLLGLIAQIEQVAKNPYDAKSVEFMARLKNILQTYHAKHPYRKYEISNINPENTEQYLMLMMARLNLIKDERVKYNVLKFFYEEPNGKLSESARQAFILRANNAHATVEDLYNLMIVYYNDKGDVRTVFQDMEKIARRDLTAELAKEAPDLNKIEYIISLVRNGTGMLQDNAIRNQVLEIYNLQNLLMPNAAEYLSKAPDTYAQTIAARDASIDELNAKIAELRLQIDEKTDQMQTVQNELETAKQTLADAQAQNQRLNQENSALRQENASLGQSKANSETKLQKLIAGARLMKAGIGSRGIKDYQQLVEDVNAGINR